VRGPIEASVSVMSEPFSPSPARQGRARPPELVLLVVVVVVDSTAEAEAGGHWAGSGHKV
jgi:hypothetical protein